MRIILGVTGGIAAYKAADLARSLVRAGHQVQCVFTRAAEEFVQPLTFASLTGRKVITSLFTSDMLASSIEHIAVAREHDLLLVAPATANCLASFAHGIANDFLTTTYLAFDGPVILAPAMNDVMWAHEATRANVETLRRRGHTMVDPAEGFLACGTYGQGRLAENDVILAAVDQLNRPKDLTGKTILVTAGPTQEPIDPIRYISNRSTGRMGYALAEAALQRGAKVILISGPTSLTPPRDAEFIAVKTAAEMYAAVFSRLEDANIVIKCAAVADYTPTSPAAQKIKKTTASASIDLQPTVDILAELGQKHGDRLLIGFAAETENLLQHAQNKLKSKNCDMIVANPAGIPGAGFESETNEVFLLLRSGEYIPLPRASKTVIAGQILDQILKLK